MEHEYKGWDVVVGKTSGRLVVGALLGMDACSLLWSYLFRKHHVSIPTKKNSCDNATKSTIIATQMIVLAPSTSHPYIARHNYYCPEHAPLSTVCHYRWAPRCRPTARARKRKLQERSHGTCGILTVPGRHLFQPLGFCGDTESPRTRIVYAVPTIPEIGIGRDTPVIGTQNKQVVSGEI